MERASLGVISPGEGTVQFQNATSVELRPLRVELIEGSPAVSRGLLGWILGRGPGVARIGHRWSGAQHRSIAAAPETPLLKRERPGELLFDYHHRRKLGLDGARRLAQVGLFLALSGLALVYGPREGLALLGGEPVAGVTYIVEEGDSLGRIAATWNVTVAELRKANALPDEVIWVGQELALPLEPVPVPEWRSSLRAAVEARLTPVQQQRVAQAAWVCAWLAAVCFAGVPIALLRRRYARHTLWLYDLHPNEASAMTQLYAALQTACESGLRTLEGTPVRFEERGIDGLLTTASTGTLTVGTHACVLLPDRVLVHERDVMRTIYWDEFVLQFPTPDVMTGQGIGMASTTLMLRTRLFSTVLTHPDPRVLEHLERVLHLIRD